MRERSGTSASMEPPSEPGIIARRLFSYAIGDKWISPESKNGPCFPNCKLVLLTPNRGGVEKRPSHHAHNVKIAGSNPAPTTARFTTTYPNERRDHVECQRQRF